MGLGMGTSTTHTMTLGIGLLEDSKLIVEFSDSIINFLLLQFPI